MQQPLGFEVWVEDKTLTGDAEITRCIAAFYYWQEALDYKEYALKRGKPVLLRTQNVLGDWRGEWRYPEPKEKP